MSKKRSLTEAEKKILIDINNRIPAHWKAEAMKEVLIAPDLIKGVEEMLNNPDVKISDEKRKKLQTLWDSGELHKTEIQNDEKMMKKINKFIDKEIDKEIKLGNLPERDKVIFE